MLFVIIVHKIPSETYSKFAYKYCSEIYVNIVHNFVRILLKILLEIGLVTYYNSSQALPSVL